MKEFTLAFVLSFIVGFYWVAMWFHFNYEPKERPSWYGTYYSFQDAMEDGWYDLEENRYAKN